MLPLGGVLFAVTRSTATAGVLVAAFVLASAPAPLRGRIVDRRGPPALAAFAAGGGGGRGPAGGRRGGRGGRGPAGARSRPCDPPGGGPPTQPSSSRGARSP